MKETIFYLPFFKKDRQMLTMLAMATVLIIGIFYELDVDHEDFFSMIVVFGGIFLILLLRVLLPIPLIKITNDAIYYSSKLRTDVGGLHNNLYPLFDPLTFELKIEHIASVSEDTYIFTLTKDEYLEGHLKLLSEQYLALVKSEKRPPEFLLLLEKLSNEDRHKFFSILKNKLK